VAETVAPARRPAHRPTVDVGRVVVVALFVLTMTSATGHAVLLVRDGGPGGQVLLELSSSLLTIAFCALVVAAYLRRGPATATDRSPAAWVAAPLATCLPFVLPALPVTVGGTGRSALAFALVLGGTAWSVWAVRHLATNLSVVPQARGLVDSGPYRLVRHPLYLGEIVAVSGFAVRAGHWSHGLLVVALLALQLYRASREERLLRAVVPGYAGYADRTWRIVPGVV
jgi:protein-S-isoprenylcysteine O-methyltransferase Ste14